MSPSELASSSVGTRPPVLSAPQPASLAPSAPRTWFRAAVHWLLGDIPQLERDPRAGALVIWFTTAAAFGMWLGLRQSPKGDPVLVGAWRMLAHGGVPLAALVAWELREARKTSVGAVIAGLGAALLLAPVVVRLSPERALLDAHPLLALTLPTLAGAAIAVLGLRAAGHDVAKWGVGLGDWRWWLPHHGVLLAALVPVLVLVTWLTPELASYYPVNKAARVSLDAFAWAHLGLALDFIGWEFLFRGFLLFGFARRGDALLAIVFQSMPFYLLHANKPDIELGSSLFGAMIAGWFCLRARSFFPLYVIHLTMITVVGGTSFALRQGWF